MELLGELKLNALQIIQLMVAPAVMISACGLLLLSLNNRYSMVVNRIRILNEEKRKLMKQFGEAYSTDDNVRLESLAKQIQFLIARARLVKNSVISYSIAIALFILTSLLLGISSVLSLSKLNYFIIAAFLGGMVSVFSGVLFTVFEARKGFEIIMYEVKSHE